MGKMDAEVQTDTTLSLAQNCVEWSVNVVRKEHPSYDADNKEFYVSFHNLSNMLCVRDLRSDKVGKLVR